MPPVTVVHAQEYNQMLTVNTIQYLTKSAGVNDLLKAKSKWSSGYKVQVMIAPNWQQLDLNSRPRAPKASVLTTWPSGLPIVLQSCGSDALAVLFLRDHRHVDLCRVYTFAHQLLQVN